MNNLPQDLPPETNNPILQMYGFSLWVCSIILGLATNGISIDQNYLSWLDVCLNIIGKLAPLISTFFLYIINRREIDKYFREKFKRKKQE